ncbi:MAG: hypothetical protein RL215_815, partial [Planctomycetota bacterium]
SQEYQVRVQLEVVLPEPDENSAPAA